MGRAEIGDMRQRQDRNIKRRKNYPIFKQLFYKNKMKRQEKQDKKCEKKKNYPTFKQ